MEIIKILVVAILLAATGSLVAYGQQNQAKDIAAPLTQALTTFWNTLAESATRVIAASILLLIGLAVGKVIGNIVYR
ncbi:MAG: mechanosensitive ion channel family protein, partial [Nitrososphaerales archaeon]